MCVLENERAVCVYVSEREREKEKEDDSHIISVKYSIFSYLEL